MIGDLDYRRFLTPETMAELQRQERITACALCGYRTPFRFLIAGLCKECKAKRKTHENQS